jgi:Icc protein
LPGREARCGSACRQCTQTLATGGTHADRYTDFAAVPGALLESLAQRGGCKVRWIAMNSRVVRLLHVTDPHLLGDESGQIYDVNTSLSLRSVLQQARSDHAALPDAILVTGDIADDCSSEAYAQLRSQLQGWDVPVLCLPGNHDAPALMARMLGSDGVQYCGRAGFGDWAIVLLDSHLPRNPSGRVAAPELERLEAELRDAAERHVLVCLHHPPVPVGSAWLDAVGLQNGAEVLRVAERFSNVRAMLAGHVHQAFDTRTGRLRILTTPSTCAQFTPDTEDCKMDLRPPGYRWIELRADGSIRTEVSWLRNWVVSRRPTDSYASFVG